MTGFTFLSLWVILTLGQFGQSTDETTRPTRYGLVSGITHEGAAASAHVYLGVPYAKPPVGELRFKVRALDIMSFTKQDFTTEKVVLSCRPLSYEYELEIVSFSHNFVIMRCPVGVSQWGYSLTKNLFCHLSGRHLFQYSVPPEPWHGRTFNATYERPWCVQFWYPDERLEKRRQSEDCLYLNIFVPVNVKRKNFLLQLIHLHLSLIKISIPAPYPVLVWIHGGSFQVGGANAFPVNGTVENLISRGVVVVTINYRLGPLGK